MRPFPVRLCGVSQQIYLLLWCTICITTWDQVVAAEEIHDLTNNVDQELLLTREEKLAFDKFKTTVYPNISHPFIKQDIYLLRWIRAKDLNVKVAVQDMLELLQFLRRNKVSDKILDEDWSDMIEDHPFHFDALDYDGRPVVYGSAGEGWNIRRTILQGKQVRFMRYTYYVVWKVMKKFMEINRQYPNVTQCLVLMNMDGFNVHQHSCPLCVTSYLHLLEMYERFIPGYVKDIIVINAPQAYLVLLEVLRPVLSPQTRIALRVFDSNKRKWKPYIDARVDPSQLPSYFGGKRMELQTF